MSKDMNLSVAPCYSKTGYFKSLDGTALFYRHHLADKPKASILIVHGFGEHSGRYSHLIDRLLVDNFEVFSFDLRGHGNSQGSRGDVVKFSNYVEDAQAALEFAQSLQNHQGKLFILAHSMGALVTLKLMTKISPNIGGLVLSSPLFALSLAVPWYKKHLGTVATCLFPKLPLKSTIRGCHLSSDQSFSAAYDNDPLILKSVSIRAFRQILLALTQTSKLASNIHTPFLMQIAGKDLVVDSNAALTWFKNVKDNAPDRSLKIYPHFLHEIFNEKNRDEPINDAIEWFNKRV